MEVLSKIEELLPKLKSEVVKLQTQRLLEKLRCEIALYNIEGLPLFMVAEEESGACIIEWPIGGGRLGFGIEPCEDESGWFFIGPKRKHWWQRLRGNREVSYGLIKELNVSWLLGKLIRRNYGR